MSLADIKRGAKAQGWWVDSDSLPLDAPLLLMLGSKPGLDQSAMVGRLALAGVTAYELPQNPKWNQLYFFTGVVAGLDLVSEDGSLKRVTTTPSTIEQIVGVPVALVQRDVRPGALTTGLVDKLRELEEARVSNEGKRIYGQTEEIPAGVWVIARLYAPTLPATAVLREKLRDLGYKALALDVGFVGMFVASTDWQGRGWAEVLVSTDDDPLVASDLRERLGVEVTFYSTPQLVEKQGDVEVAYQIQKAEQNAKGVLSGAGEATQSLVEGLSDILGGVGKYAKTALYVGAGLFGLWVVVKVVRAFRPKRRTVERSREQEWR